MLDSVLAELKQRRGSWRKIADATELDYDWLCKLVQGQIHDPGVRKIETLHRHLGLQADRTAA